MKSSKPHILIVEDEIIIAQDLKHNLNNMGYGVAAITLSGEETLEKIEILKPDLVLMDIKLKGDIDGIETTAQIQTKYDIPVVYITANADTETVERASKTEPYGFVHKPVQLIVLRTAIEMALYKHGMEKKLRERETWLDATLHSIGDAVIATNTKSKITFMNPVAELLTGCKQQESVGRPLTEVFRIINKQTRKTVTNPVEKAIKKGVIVGLADDTLLIAQDGREFEIADSASTIRDIKGNITGAVLVFRDVTVENKIKEALQENEHRLRNIIESTPLGMHIYELQENNRLVFIGANPSADRILGVDHTIFYGKTIEEAFPSLAQTEVPARYKEAAAQGKYWETQQISYSDGKISGAFEVHAFQTSPGKMVAMFQDITERKKIEEDLNLKNRAITSSFNAVAIADMNGKLTFVNNAFLNMWGFTLEESMNSNIVELASDKNVIEQIYKDIKEKGFSIGESVARHQDGSFFYIQYLASQITNEANKPVAMLAIFIDITERKKSQQVIQESEERLNFAMSAINDAIWELKSDQEILYWSPSYFTMLGYEPNEFTPSVNTWKSLLHPDDFEQAEQALHDCYNNITDEYNQEFRLLHKNGSYLWIHSRGKVIKRDQDSKVIRMSGTHTDITERKLAQEALKQSEERYRNFINNASEGIFRIDFTKPLPINLPSPELEQRITATAIIAEANKALADMYNLKPTEMVGRMVRDFAPNCGTQIGDLLRTPDYRIIDRLEEEYKDDGSPLFIMESYTGVVENGILLRVWGVQRDITERKKAEEQIQKNLVEKDVLLKEIHHRVKNNMNVITSLLNLQAERIETKEQAIAAFEESRNRVYSMALVHDQLYRSADFSSIDMNPYILTLAQKLQQAYSPNKNITLEMDVINVFLDVNIAVPCGLILNELITNVYKHAFRNRNNGKIKINFQPCGFGCYRFQVKDDGEGLPENFNIQTCNSLGLKLVSLLTEQIDGTLEIKREHGTTFIIQFKNI